MEPRLERLKNSLEQVLIGKAEPIRLLLAALLSNGHALLEDVPGTGKTTLARALATGIGAIFHRVQFTPDLMPSDVTGGAVFRPQTGDFEIRKGPVFANILLADEINRASPRTQSALLEAMEERQVSLEGQTLSLPDPFLVLATQNPVEFHGVFPLPEAQMDRFLVRIELGYPDAEAELRILEAHRTDKPIDAMTQILTTTDVLEMQALVRQVHMDADLARYVVALVRATRENRALRLGASPRAGMALYRMAQARAWMEGRTHVLPEDIQAMIIPVLAHRIHPADSRGFSSAARILEEIRTTVVVPR